ncbi:MAG: ABC transporter permease [Alphaproteobacteria bacterium]|nr:MAG: ABC transporter permease [Alphaproteobacteria bacterium]
MLAAVVVWSVAVIGVLGTVAASLGVQPGLRVAPSLDAWVTLVSEPGLGGAVLVTLVSAGVGLGLALAFAIAIAARFHAGGVQRAVLAALPLILAVPHGSIAVGLAQTLGPSGLIGRLGAQLFGWAVPPDWPIPHDPWGLTLALALVMKETPFLVLAIIGASAALPVEKLVSTARTLGRSPTAAWMEGVLPAVWPQLRLPMLAAAGYALAPVDLASVLAPTAPPPLALLAMQLFLDPDPTRAAVGSAAALAVAALALGLYGALRLAGRVRVPAWVVARGAEGGLTLLALLTGLAITVLLLWSIAWSWRFPALVPSAWGLRGWRQVGLDAPVLPTLLFGAITALLATVLAIQGLARGVRGVAIALPLLVPAIAMMPGLYLALVVVRLDGTAIAVILLHLAFALPYAWGALAGPWHALSHQPERVAATLGAGPIRRLLTVRLPRLARPLAMAAAVAFAVSAGQYLSTLVAGGGVWRTLATEAVALSTSGDRRVIAATALAAALLPVGVFSLALWFTRPRRDRGRPA